MSHICGRTTADKVLSAFQNPPNSSVKCCSASKQSTDSKYFRHCSKTHGQQKLKRLKTRKERSQMKSGWKQSTKSKPLHCHCQSKKDSAYFKNCSHSSCHWTSRRSTPISNIVPAPQEPSIITDSRLTGHHGLFSHEVKSIDIERLLIEQSKHKKREDEAKRSRRSSNSLLYSSSHVAGPPSGSLLEADAKASGSVLHRSDNGGGIQNDTVDAEVHNLLINNEVSVITSGLDVSPMSLKSFSSSTHGLHNVETPKISNVVSDRDKELLLTPCLEQPKNKQDSETQTDIFNPVPLPSSSSSVTDTRVQPSKQDTDGVSSSVSSLAARLCKSFGFPLLKKRSLLSECRKALLKSLRKNHGPWLKENLSEVQQCISMLTTRATEEHKQPPKEENKAQPFSTDKPHEYKEFYWTSSPQQGSQLQTVDWLSTPRNTSIDPLDKTFRPRFSPQFNMDFEPSVTSASDLFANSLSIFQSEKDSPTVKWNYNFIKPKSQKTFHFDSFEKSFTNPTTEVRKATRESQSYCHNVSSHQEQMLDDHAAESTHFPLDQNSFKTDRYTFPSAFALASHYSSHSSNFQPFSQFTEPPSAFSALRPHQTDMKHYPPSHELEKSPEPRPTPFPSPEHWSFPPLRLY